MTPQDMAALHARCFALPPPWSAGAFAATLRDPTAFALTEAEGFLLGRCVAGEAELLTLAIAPQARRRGLGTRLVTRFVYQARLRGADEAFLEVAHTNSAALALYAKLGFAAAGLRRGYYHGPDGARADAIVMRRLLRNPAGTAAT